MPVINLGTVHPVYKGTYDANTAYEFLNRVDDGNGKTYEAKQDNVAGSALTDESLWQLVFDASVLESVYSGNFSHNGTKFEIGKTNTFVNRTWIRVCLLRENHANARMRISLVSGKGYGTNSGGDNLGQADIVATIGNNSNENDRLLVNATITNNAITELATRKTAEGHWELWIRIREYSMVTGNITYPYWHRNIEFLKGYSEAEPTNLNIKTNRIIVLG